MKKKGCTLSLRITSTMRAIKPGESIKIPATWTSRQAMYIAKYRLNKRCGWEQWTYDAEKKGRRIVAYVVWRYKEPNEG